VYLTNAVKHFRWQPAPRGHRRLHRRPDVAQILACAPWLQAELAALRPTGVVALGAVAARVVFGSGFALLDQRGTVFDWPPAGGVFAEDTVSSAHTASTVNTDSADQSVAPGREATGGSIRFALATVHPSAVLRAGSPGRTRLMDQLVADLSQAARAVGPGAA
jgi:DNA polymerase